MPRLRRLAAAAALTATLAGAIACKGKNEGAGNTRDALKVNLPSGASPGTASADDAPPRGPGLAGLDRFGAINTTPIDSRKIVRTGHLALIVTGYDETRDKLEAIVREAGGFVDSTRVSRAEGEVSSAVIVLRIPADGFGDLLPRLRALGEIQEESTDAADITDAYVDAAGRLTGARAFEKRLLELAATGTGKVSEVLEVERELSRIRGEIEQLEGQLRMWNDQVSLSTLTVSLATRRPEIAAAAEPSFGKRVSSAWNDSIDALGDAAEGLSIAFIALLPWLPLLGPLGFFGVRYLRRRSRLPRAVALPEAPLPPTPAS
jgi:hypothetical protein